MDLLLANKVEVEKALIEEKQKPKRLNWEAIEEEYYDELIARNCTPDQFFEDKILVSKPHRTTCFRHMKRFDLAYETKNRVIGDGAKVLSMFDSLEHYIADNPQMLSG